MESTEASPCGQCHRPALPQAQQAQVPTRHRAPAAAHSTDGRKRAPHGGPATRSRNQPPSRASDTHICCCNGLVRSRLLWCPVGVVPEVPGLRHIPPWFRMPCGMPLMLTRRDNLRWPPLPSLLFPLPSKELSCCRTGLLKTCSPFGLLTRCFQGGFFPSAASDHVSTLVFSLRLVAWVCRPSTADHT